MGQFEGAFARSSQPAHVQQTGHRRFITPDRRGFIKGGLPAFSTHRSHPRLSQSIVNAGSLEIQSTPTLPQPTATRSTTNSATSPAKASTSVWPCRDGQLVRVLQSSSVDGSHSLQITVEGLPDGQDADILWYVYKHSLVDFIFEILEPILT